MQFALFSLEEPENGGQPADVIIKLLENPAQPRVIGVADYRRAEMSSRKARVNRLVSCHGSLESI